MIESLSEFVCGTHDRLALNGFSGSSIKLSKLIKISHSKFVKNIFY